ncbi:MAG: hypothetical protein ABSA92_07980 [Candidatus Bathyarchaeia archaeon]|jgi:hypothetical protein
MPISLDVDIHLVTCCFLDVFVMDAKINVWIKNLRPETGKVYGGYLRMVLGGEDPAAAVEAAVVEPENYWSENPEVELNVSSRIN